jgi:hypothetical protein
MFEESPKIIQLLQKQTPKLVTICNQNLSSWSTVGSLVNERLACPLSSPALLFKLQNEYVGLILNKSLAREAKTRKQFKSLE